MKAEYGEISAVGREPHNQMHQFAPSVPVGRSSLRCAWRYADLERIVTEIVKNKPGTTMYYEVGDEYSSSSYYPKGNTRYGNGLVIFFTGSPAQMALSMTYSGDRISGLGDMPLKLFREKCAETNA